MEPINFSPYLRLIQRTGATKHPYGFSATDFLLKRIELSNETKVLDVGCGAGHSSAYIAKTYGCHVTGVDISTDALLRAHALHAREPYFDRLTFVEGDALHLPFDDGQFDVVVCESVLFFVHDKEAAITEMARVLKTGGYLALNEVIIADVDDKQKVKDYFLRPEFGGFLVAADDLLDTLATDSWSIVVQDEKPFDIKQQLQAELRQALSFKSLLPLLELAHQAWVSKETRDDLFQVVKFMIDMPKGVWKNLNSFLLLAQKKKPLG